MSVSSAGIVEERRLAAVGVTHQCHVQCAVFMQSHVLQIVVGVTFRRNGKVKLRQVRRQFLCRHLVGCQYLNHLSFLTAQTYFVAH